MMTTDIDWSGWTEEYPLWVESLKIKAFPSAWHKETEDGIFEDRNGQQWAPTDERSGHIDIHRRPEPVAEAAEWTGEGIPPVGCECEYRYLDAWHLAKVIGFDGPACVVAVDGIGYAGSKSPLRFRPALTPEQKSLAARITTIAHMKELFRDNGFWAIYDAGYRLPGGEE